jgi:hypothetical protein
VHEPLQQTNPNRLLNVGETREEKKGRKKTAFTVRMTSNGEEPV